MNPLPPILPTGTAVVALVEIRGRDGRPLHPRGAAGVVVKSPAGPEHSYRVRFPGGDEHALKRRDLEPLKHYAAPSLLTHSPDHSITQSLLAHTILRAITGSRAYGLSRDESDTDRRGVYLPPAHMHWSIYGVPEQIDDGEDTYWELGKFLKLALKANPNILEILYTPLVEHATPLARELLSIRSSFLSKLIFQTFNGYAMSQFKKMGADLRNTGRIKWKHAMHLIRLLLAGAAALRTGEVPVLVEEPHRDALLAIRGGRTPFEEVDRWRLALHADFERAYAETTLPDRPDYDRANAFLIKARREMAARETTT